MTWNWGSGLVAGAMAATLTASGGAAQVALPELVVTAPSPIRRPPSVTVTPEPTLAGTLPVVTDQFATVTVIPEAELRRSTGSTLGDLLFAKPGITGSSFAPGGASRPIVRGLDNYRVRIQENGLAVNDVSDLSEDHTAPIDPLAAKRIEVIRGPATLRYGSQAIGGVVNVENDRIPTALPPRPVVGELFGAVTSVDRGLEGSAQVDAGAGNFAFHADAYARSAGDYGIPGYPYRFPPVPAPAVNGRQPNSAFNSAGQSAGGSYLFHGGFVGVSVSQFNSVYGIPGVEATETNTHIDMRQTKVATKGEIRSPSSAIDAIRFWGGATDYRHDEIANEGGFSGVQQSFTNRAQEARVEVQLAPFDLRFGSLTTALGVQGAHQRLAAPGREGGLFDPNRSGSAAVFMFNELKLSEVLRAQLAGRIEQANVTGTATIFPSLLGSGPAPTTGSLDRTFTPKSASFGVLRDLPWGLVASVTAQYVERAPRAPEMVSRGVHEATGTFEMGNPNLVTESAKSIEIGLRRAQGPFRFEATAYYTRFNNFIYKRLTGNTCDDDFASCAAGGAGEFAQVVYAQRAATFRGAEFQAQLDLVPLGGGMAGIDGQYDVLRATFADGTNVPRIPPHRLGGGVYWRDPHWFVRLGLLHAFAQHRIAAEETTTPGYNLLKFEAAYSRQLQPTALGPREFAMGITGTNLLDEKVRNAVSFKKDEVLMPGRSVRLFTRVTF